MLDFRLLLWSYPLERLCFVLSGFILSFWWNSELSIVAYDLWPILHPLVSVGMMTQEGWNLTQENGKRMTELVMTIGLVTTKWVSTTEKHQASVPAPSQAPHLALLLLPPAVERGSDCRMNINRRKQCFLDFQQDRYSIDHLTCLPSEAIS